MNPTHSGDRYTLYCGDCLEVLPRLAPQSADCIICDLPYGVTNCSWDTVIPFAPMWAAIKHVIKPRAAVVLFGSQPFTSALVMSNVEWFKYCLVWDKKLAGNFLNANRTPLMVHEDICVFGSAGVTYNPQMTTGRLRNKGRKTASSGDGSSAYGAYDAWSSFNNIYYPTSIITKSNGDRTNGNNGQHPTQKPVSICEYLIKTYTNEGDVVLDFTMGSGTTGAAALPIGRRFIGVELDAHYYAIAHQRIANAAGDYMPAPKDPQNQLSLFWEATP